jgi:hypothetical protein
MLTASMFRIDSKDAGSMDFREVGNTADRCMIPLLLTKSTRARGSVVVEEVCHKPEGRGFETR